MKTALIALTITGLLSMSMTGCGGGRPTTEETTNKSEAVVQLINDTAKIYEELGTQLESTATSGKAQSEIVADLQSIAERYQSRLDIEIASEFAGMDVKEVRAYYYAIAGHEVEKPEWTDPQVQKQIDRLRGLRESLSLESPLGDHVYGCAVEFLNKSTSMAFGAIADKVDQS